MPNAPQVGMSYSWDDENHKEWVKALATRLRGDGLEVVLDQWHLGLGDRLPQFMEEMIAKSASVVPICTQGYKDRFDGRKGGVGYEGHIISGGLLAENTRARIVPVLRSGDWTTSMPNALTGVIGADLRGNPYEESGYRKLVKKLHDVVLVPPPVGQPPEWLRAADDSSSQAKSPLQGTRSGFRRRVEISSVVPIERAPAEYYEAAKRATLGSVAWPLSLYWFGHAGADQFAKREVLPNGFRMHYKQHDVLVDRDELFEAINPGKVTIDETQEFPSRHRDGGFPYDVAIGTSADAIRFGASFFSELRLGALSDLVIKISWSGLTGMFITADAFEMVPGYRNKRSGTDTISSPTVQFRVGDGMKPSLDNIHTLLNPLFNQFDLFAPGKKIYDEVLARWKNVIA